jgi:hypothetical protein
MEELRIHVNGPVRNAFDAGKSITRASRLLWAPNGTRLTTLCHFTGPKKVSISRAQPLPAFPRKFARIKNITYGAVQIIDIEIHQFAKAIYVFFLKILRYVFW